MNPRDAEYAHQLHATNRVWQDRYDMVRAESNARLNHLAEEMEKLRSEVAEMSMDKAMGYLQFSCNMKDWILENQGRGYMQATDVDAAMDKIVKHSLAEVPAALQSSAAALAAAAAAGEIVAKPTKRPIHTQEEDGDDVGEASMDDDIPCTPSRPAFLSPFTPSAKRRCVSTPI